MRPFPRAQNGTYRFGKRTGIRHAETLTKYGSTGQFEEVTRIKVANTATYAHPVIAGKRVFIKDEDAVALLTIE